MYCVVLCTVPEDGTVLYTVFEDSVLYLRTVHCTYCTLTILDLINDTNEFQINLILLLVLNLGVYGFRPKSP